MDVIQNIQTLDHNDKSMKDSKYFVPGNKYFIDLLKSLKERIESTNTFHQIEILKIFHENGVLVNENKNGVFINLTYVDSCILDKVYKYLSYVNKQEDQLNEIEKEKEKIVTSFFK
jgi:outer membrane translocation and assembly module TamA